MTLKQENRLINNINRILIAALSLIGMTLDGAQCADFLLELAVVMWLWLPEWRRWEIGLLHCVERRLAK